MMRANSTDNLILVRSTNAAYDHARVPECEAARTPQCPTKHLLLAQVDASLPEGGTFMAAPDEEMYERVPDASQYRITCTTSEGRLGRCRILQLNLKMKNCTSMVN